MNNSKIWLLMVPVLLVGCNETAAPEPVTTPEPVVEVEVNQPAVSEEGAPTEPLETEAPQSEPETAASLEETSSDDFDYTLDYETPKGTTELAVRFTVEGNVLSGVVLDGNRRHNTSFQYIKALEGELQSLVVGKLVQDLDPVGSKVAGASLTVPAFNDALAKLQSDA